MKRSEIVAVILTSGNRKYQPLRDALQDRLDYVMVYRNDGNGAAIGTRNAIRMANGLYSGCKHVLFLEDDVIMHPRFIEFLQTVEFSDDVAVISFCDMREMPSGSPHGLYTKSPMGCDDRGWWGNQAMLIHRDTADYLSNCDWDPPYVCSFPAVLAHAVNYGDLAQNCSDIRMALLVYYNAASARRKYAVHDPSLFKHVGMESLCFPDRAPVLGERETRNYLGD